MPVPAPKNTNNGIRTSSRVVTPKPMFALVVHGNSRSNSAIAAVSRHNIDNSNTLGMGTLLSPEEVVNALSHIDGQRRTIDLVPEQLLVENDKQVIWWKKSFNGPMWFRMNGKPFCVTVRWPPLIFLANKNGALRVFALGKNNRPALSSKLFHAPLMNIGAQGELCQGTARLPRQINVETLQQCESTLIESQFTHTNHQNTLRGGANNKQHIQFWQKKKRTGQRVYVREMEPFSTLKATLEKFA